MATGQRVWVIQVGRRMEHAREPKVWTRITQRVFSGVATDSEAPMLPVTFDECERWAKGNGPDGFAEFRIANVETGQGVPLKRRE